MSIRPGRRVPPPIRGGRSVALGGGSAGGRGRSADRLDRLREGWQRVPRERRRRAPASPHPRRPPVARLQAPHAGRQRHRGRHPQRADPLPPDAARKRLGRPHKVATGLRNSGSLHDLAFSPAVSPNGRQVALSNTLLQGIYDPSTGVRGLNLLAITIEYRSARSGRRVGERHVPGDYLESPSWVDDRHVLVFAPLVSYATQVDVDTRGGEMQSWFADELGGDPAFDRPPLNDGRAVAPGRQARADPGTNLTEDCDRLNDPDLPDERLLDLSRSDVRDRTVGRRAVREAARGRRTGAPWRGAIAAVLGARRSTLRWTAAACHLG